ncbi:MAG: RagB/SusD family nutrient uptake outer membrane protein [Bacteroidetes bacterium]|nr:RagB/SusD family nutrient uptake outer membrane protein [Bacteroidota bacterium]
MNKTIYNIRVLLVTGIAILGLSSCEEFFNPVQETIIPIEGGVADWEDYRAAELGLYKLQQDLVDQLVVLGELRADLLEVTPNADKDLLEVYNFTISPDNKYASPVGFYRLIGACNNLAARLESAHPEVVDPGLAYNLRTKYDRIYGEVICMRAWAYFNAVRIFEKVPYIWQDLTTAESIEEYVNTGVTVIDSMRIIYGPDGYNNDTIYNDTVNLERKFLDLHAVIDTFTHQIEERVTLVGVLHDEIGVNDNSWDVIIWNEDAKNCLMGQMFLHDNNLSAAREYIEKITRYRLYNDIFNTNVPYILDSRFGEENWKNIFLNNDGDESIMTVWFNLEFDQQNDLQYMFSDVFPNQYMLKPTAKAVSYWENIWYEQQITEDPSSPDNTKMWKVGFQGDFFRGHKVSYAYSQGGMLFSKADVEEMFHLKRVGKTREVEEMMQNVDTVVHKYSLGKERFDQDAIFPIYRAAGMHFYYAELFARGVFYKEGFYSAEINTCLAVINDGTYDIYSSENNASRRPQGIRGRVGFGGVQRLFAYDKITSPDRTIYIHDPNTNEIIGHYSFGTNLAAKQNYLEDKLLEEKAREMAFEGERFYDLVRIAKRRGDPAVLANRVAGKFSGAKAELIREHLMNEHNWYIHPW